MTARSFTESIVEDACLPGPESLGYAILHGPDIAAGMFAAERSDPTYRDVVPEERLRQALAGLNSNLPPEAQIPALFATNAASVVSDGVARALFRLR